MWLCNRCMETKKTCCQERPRIVLTTGDVRRIRQAAGRDDFYKLEHWDDLSFLDNYRFDPNWRKYTVLPGNRRRTLAWKPDGECSLLGKEGCAAGDAQPLLCRLYPYECNEFGLIGWLSPDDMWCPRHLIEKGQDLFTALRMNLDDLEQVRRQLYEELRAEHEGIGG